MGLFRLLASTVATRADTRHSQADERSGSPRSHRHLRRVIRPGGRAPSTIDHVLGSETGGPGERPVRSEGQARRRCARTDLEGLLPGPQPEPSASRKLMEYGGSDGSGRARGRVRARDVRARLVGDVQAHAVAKLAGVSARVGVVKTLSARRARPRRRASRLPRTRRVSRSPRARHPLPPRPRRR